MKREHSEIEVTHYTHALRSGAALYVFNLARAIARRGMLVNLICSRDYEYVNRLSTIEGVRVYADLPPLSGASGRGRKLWRMLGQAAIGFRAARALRPGALIHVNFPGLIFFTAPLLVGFRLSSLKVVLTVHDVLPHRWLLPQPLRVLEQTMLWTAYLAANRLVVHHREALELLHGRFGIPLDKVSIIPHGPFNLSEVPPLYKESDEITALLFGSLRENKGIHLAVRAVQELRAAKLPIRLIIAGGPYASEQAYWRRCLESIAVAPEGISVVDRYIEEHEVRDIIAGTHLFLLPYTEFRSQSGVAALAMSNSRPIVATRAGGLSELLIPSRTGLPIEHHTVEGVKEALEQAVRAGHAGLARMGREAFSFFEDNYSWEAIADEYAKLYQRLGIGSEDPREEGRVASALRVDDALSSNRGSRES